MTRPRYRINRCHYCYKILWPWQNQGNKNFAWPAHIGCIDKDFWNGPAGQSKDIQNFHFSHFGTKPWTKP